MDELAIQLTHALANRDIAAYGVVGAARGLLHTYETWTGTATGDELIALVASVLKSAIHEYDAAHAEVQRIEAAREGRGFVQQLREGSEGGEGRHA